MRLLHVVAAMDPTQGGVAQAVRSMIKGLFLLQIESEVVSLDHPGEKFLSVLEFPVHALGPGKGPWQHSSRLVPWLLNNLARFDAVIIHGLWLYPSFAAKRALQLHVKKFKALPTIRSSVPKIYVMPHGMLDPYFQTAPGRKLKAVRNRLYWNFFEEAVVNGAEKVLFTTEEECRLARKSFRPYHPKEEAVVSLGVEEPPLFSGMMKDAFAQRCPNLGDSPYFLFLSRIHEKKGTDLLINAYALCLNRMCGAAMETGINRLPKLVIAGPGLETTYGKRLQEIVTASPLLSQHVIFTGMLTGDAKWGAFYGCEAFVLPSHQENFGIAVVEAMACQKPVLISNRINIWREIEATQSGFTADPTLDGVEKLLQSWIDLSGETKLKVGLNAFKLFQQSFTLEAAAKQLVTAVK